MRPGLNGSIGRCKYRDLAMMAAVVTRVAVPVMSRLVMSVMTRVVSLMMGPSSMMSSIMTEMPVMAEAHAH